MLFLSNAISKYLDWRRALLEQSASVWPLSQPRFVGAKELICWPLRRQLCALSSYCIPQGRRDFRFSLSLKYSLSLQLRGCCSICAHKRERSTIPPVWTECERRQPQSNPARNEPVVAEKTPPRLSTRIITNTVTMSMQLKIVSTVDNCGGHTRYTVNADYQWNDLQFRLRRLCMLSVRNTGHGHN